MDSLTQFTLGAAIGVVAFGRKMGPRKAAIVGGALGTLPDLDVFLPADDPIDAFIGHRGFSHSLIVHTALAPLIGEGLRRLFEGLRAHRAWTIFSVWIILTTHALLDAMTVYGTKLLWPLTDYPFGMGSLFIIDPFYTLPILIPVLWALLSGIGPISRGPVLMKTMAIMLAVSTGYAGWSIAAQAWATSRIETALRAEGVTADRLLVTPMPFSTILWKGIAIDGDRYFNVYSSLLDNGDWATGQIFEHQRHTALMDGLTDPTNAENIARFTKGFYGMLAWGDAIIIRDLRMGATPNYVFTFKIANGDAAEARPIEPVQMESPRASDGDMAWLFSRITDQTLVRNEPLSPSFR
ncbi:MAG: metal-dependent hydrolase [Alphaproteobacteria bacterium]|nr:metal-dependent hydrolase [Alphaproteobacteria bacterium]